MPGLHDPVAKAALLKKSNEEMRKRISELRNGLDQERTRLKETHREKVKELHDLRDSAEVASHYLHSCSHWQLEKHRTLEAQKTKLLEVQANETKKLQDQMEKQKQIDFEKFRAQWERSMASRLLEI